MYELLGALAFALLAAGYVLAVVFVRHQDDDSIGQSVRRDARDSGPAPRDVKSVSQAP